MKFKSNTYAQVINSKLKTNPQNKKGPTILGSLLDKNDLTDHCLPNDRAPESIRNRGTPILKKFVIKSVKSHFFARKFTSPYTLFWSS